MMDFFVKKNFINIKIILVIKMCIIIVSYVKLFLLNNIIIEFIVFKYLKFI